MKPVATADADLIGPIIAPDRSRCRLIDSRVVHMGCKLEHSDKIEAQLAK